jgi:hypothetical protein
MIGGLLGAAAQAKAAADEGFARGALYASPSGFASGHAAPGLAREPGSGTRQFIGCSTLDCEAPGNHGGPPMIFASFLALLPALFGFASAPVSGELAQVRRVIVQDKIIIRVPVRVRRVAPAMEWIERKGPKCIDSEALRGGFLSGPDSIDFVLRGQKRMRAVFDTRCPALDFYGVFYLNTQDDKVCAGRDMVRSRVGSSCVIEKFRRLSPQRRH